MVSSTNRMGGDLVEQLRRTELVLAYARAVARLERQEGWVQFVDRLKTVRQAELEALARIETKSDDFRFHQGYVAALTMLLGSGALDPKAIERIEGEVEGLRRKVSSMQDADLLARNQPEVAR